VTVNGAACADKAPAATRHRHAILARLFELFMALLLAMPSSF
jgi:hypothetical protein